MRWPEGESAVNSITQILTVTALNLRTLPQRLGSSLVLVIGIAGVVAVLVSVLSMSVGFRQTILGGSREDRAIVVPRGAEAEQENLSVVTRADVVTIENLPGIRSVEGKPAISAEVLAIASVSKKSDGSDAFVSLRGVGANAFAVRPELKLVAGRIFRPGEREVIVGRAAQSQFSKLDPGNQIALGDSDWTVVGVFESQGSVHESTLIADAEAVLAAYKRKSFNSVAVLLASPESFTTFSRALAAIPASSMEARREREFVAAQSQPLNRLLELIAYLIGGIMALGAIFGALNTMYSAVSARGTEIATLRALGFSGTSVVISVLIEAQLLALVGSLAGVSLAHILFSGHVVSTVGATVGNNPQVVFSLTMSAALIGSGIALACLVGLVGGLFPAVRAARMPIAAALRATG
jgi:putative ABC transport system permease protein